MKYVFFLIQSLLWTQTWTSWLMFGWLNIIQASWLSVFLCLWAAVTPASQLQSALSSLRPLTLRCQATRWVTFPSARAEKTFFNWNGKALARPPFREQKLPPPPFFTAAKRLRVPFSCQTAINPNLCGMRVWGGGVIDHSWRVLQTQQQQ